MNDDLLVPPQFVSEPRDSIRWGWMNGARLSRTEVTFAVSARGFAGLQRRTQAI
jgi:hypothetical protein